MKPIHCLAAGLCLLVSGLAFARSPVASAAQGGSTDERVATLERELSITNARLLAAEKELKDAVGLLEQVSTYLEVQGQASDAMMTTLEASEAAGFAWGENFRSREILLAGWRDQLAAVKQSLPRAKPVATEPPAPTPGARRSKAK